MGSTSLRARDFRPGRAAPRPRWGAGQRDRGPQINAAALYFEGKSTQDQVLSR